jgi:hypothetical protein
VISIREYRILKALNKIAEQRKSESPVAKKANGEIINVGISGLKVNAPQYSDDIIYTTLLILRDRALICAAYTNPEDESLIMWNMEKAGRVAIHDYPKELFLCFAKNFFIPIVAAGFFSALFVSLLSA